MAAGVGFDSDNGGVDFKKCKRSCLTCSSMVVGSSFKSSVSSCKFDCVFEFGELEERIISCKSTNLVYFLQ